MTLKSTTSSLNLANVPASLGLANSAIIPTDRDQVMREPGLPWKRRAVTSEVPTGGSWQGWVTPGSGMCLRGTRATEAPGSRGMDQHPCPLTDVERFSLPEKDYLGPPTTGLSKVDKPSQVLGKWVPMSPSVAPTSAIHRLSKDAVVPTTMRCPCQQAPSGVWNRPTCWRSPNLWKPGGQQGKSTPCSPGERNMFGPEEETEMVNDLDKVVN